MSVVAFGIGGCLAEPPAYDVSGTWSGMSAAGDTFHLRLRATPRPNQDFYDVTGDGVRAPASGAALPFTILGDFQRGGSLAPGLVLFVRLTWDSLPPETFEAAATSDTTLSGTLRRADGPFDAPRALMVRRR